MSGTGKVVCVTGASGYIASWLVKLLLQRGYTVKATVRDPNDPKKTEHLLAFDGAKERLHLFKANLVEEGSFDSAVNGCEGVFHFHTASLLLLSATDPESWYMVSKTLAEEAAWRFAKENEIDLVTINPRCDDKPSIPGYQVSKEKAKSLGINFIPLEVTLRDTVESLKQKGFFYF